MTSSTNKEFTFISHVRHVVMKSSRNEQLRGISEVLHDLSIRWDKTF